MSLPVLGVLFDRDETLAYTDHRVYLEAAQWLAAEYGVGVAAALQALQEQWLTEGHKWSELRSDADEAAYWQRYGEALTGRLGLPAAEAEKLLGVYPYERYLLPFPETVDVLTELRLRGLKIGVFSNSYPSIGRTLSAIGIAELVDVPLASCTLGVHKPEPKSFRLAAQAMALPPEQLIFVDDKLENVTAARGVGMRVYQIDHSGQTPGALTSLRDVLELLDAD